VEATLLTCLAHLRISPLPFVSQIMRFARVVPLLPLASALVITDAEVFRNIEKSERRVLDNAQNVFDGVLDNANEVFGRVKDEAKNVYSKIHQTGVDVSAWLEGSLDDGVVDFEEDHDHPHPPPHDTPPHHGPPHHGHDPHDEKPNRTVYEVCIAHLQLPILLTRLAAHQREQVHHQTRQAG
jgi:hypothetical protein